LAKKIWVGYRRFFGIFAGVFEGVAQKEMLLRGFFVVIAW